MIVMTAETTSSNAIRSTQYGAFDYISKPINDEHLILLIHRALQYRKLEKEVRSFRKTPSEAPNIPGHGRPQPGDAGGLQDDRPGGQF